MVPAGLSDGGAYGGACCGNFDLGDLLQFLQQKSAAAGGGPCSQHSGAQSNGQQQQQQQQQQRRQGRSSMPSSLVAAVPCTSPGGRSFPGCALASILLGTEATQPVSAAAEKYFLLGQGAVCG